MVALALAVANHRELAERPQRAQLCPVLVRTEIDDPGFKRDVVVVQGDQNLVAKGCQGVVVQGQWRGAVHRASGKFQAVCNRDR